MNKGIARKKDGHILIIKGPSNVNQNGQYCNISIVTYFIIRWVYRTNSHVTSGDVFPYTLDLQDQ